MIVYSSASLHQTSVHFVGNPSNEDPLSLSESLLEIQDDDQEQILNYLMRGFKPEAFFKFTTNGNLVYDAVKELFAEDGDFLSASQVVASHLYDVSTHPKILAGDLFVARIREVSLHNEYADCIVILKAERQDKFAQVEWKDKHSVSRLSDGYRLDRIDKACLIFSLEPGDGYRVLVIDNKTNGTADSQYWVDRFLELEPVEDSYHNTMETIHLVKDFIREEMPMSFEVTPADTAGLLNKSSKFFKEKQQFSIEEFGEEVLQQPELIDAFRKNHRLSQEGNEHSISESFDISSAAVKKNGSAFKSVIALDKNFHLYVHGNRALMERGYDDEKGMSYYKVYFVNETM